MYNLLYGLLHEDNIFIMSKQLLQKYINNKTIMGNKLLILSRYDRLGASSRYRYYNFLSDMEQAGLETKISPLLSNLYLTKTYQGSSRFFEIIKCYIPRFHIVEISTRLP